MRMNLMVICIIGMLALAGCSTFSVSTDYDTSVNFSTYHAYRWQKADEAPAGKDLLAANPLVYRRVRDAVDRQLAAKGYLYRETGPVDFTVSAVATVREMARLEPGPEYWNFGYYRGRGGWYRTWWGDPMPYVDYYEEGALLIDITDTSKHELSWQGIVRGMVHDYDSPEQMKLRIEEAVGKLLLSFPPVRK